MGLIDITVGLFAIALVLFTLFRSLRKKRGREGACGGCNGCSMRGKSDSCRGSSHKTGAASGSRQR